MKLLLNEIRSRNQELQQKVMAEVKESYQIFCRVDVEMYLDNSISYAKKQLGLDVKPPLGSKEAHQQRLKENIESSEQKLRLRKDGFSEEELRKIANDSLQAYHGLVSDAATRDTSYVYRPDSSSFGPRAHLYYEFDEKYNICRLHARSNLGDTDFHERVLTELSREWQKAGFGIRNI